MSAEFQAVDQHLASPTTDYNALMTHLLRQTTRHALSDTEGATPPDPTRLLHLLVTALKDPDHWTEARELLLHLNPYFEKDGRYSEWAALLEQGLHHSTLRADAQTRAVLQLYLGNLYRLQGKAQATAGLRLLEAAEQYFGQAPDSVWYVRTCNALARVLQEQGDLETAQTWAHRALETVGDAHYHERAVSYRMVGGIAARQHQWERAYDCFAECLRLYRLDGDPRLIGFGLTNLGVPLRALQRYEDAEAVLEEAIGLLEQAEDQPHLGIARIALGNLYLATRRWQAAEVQFHHAERIFEPRRDLLRLAGVYNNWGMALAGRSEWARAVRIYQRSISLWTQNGDRLQQANALDNLAIAYLALGEAERSRAACLEGLAILDTLPALAGALTRQELQTHLAEAESHLGPA